MPPVFRQLPPLDLVERYLMAYSLRGLSDTTWFTKKGCSLGVAEELLPEIVPYYTPCKAETGPLTYVSAFRILRHLLKAHAYDLKYVEKSCRGKELWYHIDSTLPPNTEVTFD
jgi:hypothetical protein